MPIDEVQTVPMVDGPHQVGKNRFDPTNEVLEEETET